MDKITSIVIAAIVAAIGGWLIKQKASSNKELKKTQKVDNNAIQSQQTTSEKVAEVEAKKEADISATPKDGKTRVKKANEKIKEFNK